MDELQEFASFDFNNFFSYQIGKAQLDLENAPYGGSRYPVSTLIDAKLFVRFQLDVGADIVVDEIEQIKGTPNNFIYYTIFYGWTLNGLSYWICPLWGLAQGTGSILMYLLLTFS